ncbi:alpha/beta fold hydrolase [Brachybacterium sp. AOP43-C2-M15]|uniref:alpha/beta fold hydrolase n=1 Tax=Brachybacterium sp. AOP43-C2-M15 TaxID=3457661 RepID=UPI004033D1F8
MTGDEGSVRTADGRRLRTIAMGAGPGLVVLEAGLGAGAHSWGPVMEHLAGHTRVLAYDRAGYGASDPDPRPRDLARLADDLLCVSRSLEHERLVLVGHSWGGPVVRTAAARLSELSGLVLVDPADEHAELYFSRGMAILGAAQGPLLEGLARVGLLRPLLGAQASGLPEPYRTPALDAASTPAAAKAMRAENAHVVRGLRGLRLDPLEIGPVPVTVISGRRAGRSDRALRDQLSTAHAASAGAHPGGRYVEAHDSGHLVPFAQPGLVADEALALLG